MLFKWKHYRISILPHKSYLTTRTNILQLYNSLDPTEGVSADVSEEFADKVIDLLTSGGNLGAAILLIRVLVAPHIARKYCLN